MADSRTRTSSPKEQTQLQHRLHREVRRDPEGPLADLALEAGAQVKVELSASFGLLSKPPNILIVRGAVIDPGLVVTYVARVAGSWDGGRPDGSR